MKVIFYGPLGERKSTKVIVGGGESGNKKTIEILKSIGCEVYTVPKPYPDHDKIYYKKFILYVIHLIKALYKILGYIRKNRNDAILHISAFYMHLIYYEYVLILIAKWYGVQVVYEIRAGGFVESYRDKGFIYKSIVRQIMRKTSFIFSQGKKNIPLLNKFKNNNIVYYPNFVDDSYICNDRSIYDRLYKEKIELIYVGRVVCDKGIETIINICKKLLYMGVEYKCNIIGDGDAEYMEILKSIIGECKGLKEKIYFVGGLDGEDIKKYLISSHYFVFPTRNKREGHSNALTEAMGMGVVPIVSDQGFNEDVVADIESIVGVDDASEYVRKIINIYSDGKWAQMSFNSRDKVYKYFRRQVILNNIKYIYCNEVY